MALQLRLIMDPSEVLRIIDNMSDSDRCSGDNDSTSDNDIISPMSENSISEATVFDDNTYQIVSIFSFFTLVNGVCPKC